MGQIYVQDSLRKKKRAIKDALGNDILRYIAELLTNSDDSYRRLENQNIDSNKEKVIYIELKKEKRKSADNSDSYVLSVTDNAEGMTLETLERIFGTYGEDNAGGTPLHARGIFGQGASDVLRASAKEKRTALIETIKDNSVSKLYYNMDENLTPIINTEKVELSENRLNDYRNNLRIPQNGTKISFGIPANVKFTDKIKDNLAELIAKYPSFRYLLNQDNRKIIYVYEGKETIISSKEYQFKDENEMVKERFSFIYEGKSIDCELKLYLNENKKNDETNIIVCDENYSVFDNTMFDFQNYPSAQVVSGELIIKGLYNLCYEHLNAEEPDAIVRDNRTGFDTKNSFYIKLNKEIAPKIQEVLNENGKENKVTNLGNNKKFNEALKKLNKYMQKELNDVIPGGPGTSKEPPLEGIKFARNSASITIGKQYTLKLYINSNMISSEDKISIICEDSCIEVTPDMIDYNEDEIDNGLVIKNISIKALECTTDSAIIQAKVNNYLATIAIDVIDLDIHYPENGLEFYPNEISLAYNKSHSLKLYVDTNVIPLKSRIEIKCDGLEINNNIVTFDEDNLLNDEVAMLEIITTGGKVNESYEVIANYVDLTTEALITLIEPSRNENNGGGLIAGFKLEPNKNMSYQAYFNPHDHIIYINTENPINLRIMGDMSDKNPNKPSFTTEQIKYLCDIISSQAASLLVKRKNVKNGEINFDDFEDAVEQVQNLVQEHKNNIYQDLYSALSSKDI
ncbi:MAG TPA: hypothetical protein DIU30_06480 [Clostridiales bacterium]|nr:hypothetical protein [Clostridiales bacterium]